MITFARATAGAALLVLVTGGPLNAQALLLDSEPAYITVFLDNSGRTARPSRSNPDSLPPADDIAIALGLCGAAISDAGQRTGSCDFRTQPASAAASQRQATVVGRARVHVTRQDGGAFRAMVVNPQSGPGSAPAAEPGVLQMIAESAAVSPCWSSACIASLTAPPAQPNPRDPRAADTRTQPPVAARTRYRLASTNKLAGEGGLPQQMIEGSVSRF